MIKLDNINKSFDDKNVISNYSYKFEDGKKYSITSPSGTGKTTLLNIICLMTKPDSGTISYSKKDLIISYDFQEDRLFDELSSVMNIKITSKIKNEDKIREELSILLPSDELDKPVSNLSGGMKRRLCIARALLFDSDCVILDEPFSGLDENNIKIAFDFIMCHLNGRTLIMTSHNFEYPNDFININL